MMDKIVIMSELFDVPITHFFENVEINDSTMLPIYGDISCGNGSIIYEATTEYEYVPKSWTAGGEYFILRAKGDSMIGSRIYDGDKLLIRKQNDVENGEIAAVLLEGDTEATLKRVKKERDLTLLIPDNRMYAPIALTEDSPGRIIGKAVRVTVEL